MFILWLLLSSQHKSIFQLLLLLFYFDINILVTEQNCTNYKHDPTLYAMLTKYLIPNEGVIKWTTESMCQYQTRGWCNNIIFTTARLQLGIVYHKQHNLWTSHKTINLHKTIAAVPTYIYMYTLFLYETWQCKALKTYAIRLQCQILGIFCLLTYPHSFLQTHTMVGLKAYMSFHL